MSEQSNKGQCNSGLSGCFHGQWKDEVFTIEPEYENNEKAFWGVEECEEKKIRFAEEITEKEEKGGLLHENGLLDKMENEHPGKGPPKNG